MGKTRVLLGAMNLIPSARIAGPLHVLESDGKKAIDRWMDTQQPLLLGLSHLEVVKISAIIARLIGRSW